MMFTVIAVMSKIYPQTGWSNDGDGLHMVLAVIDYPLDAFFQKWAHSSVVRAVGLKISCLSLALDYELQRGNCCKVRYILTIPDYFYH